MILSMNGKKIVRLEAKVVSLRVDLERLCYRTDTTCYISDPEIYDNINKPKNNKI